MNPLRPASFALPLPASRGLAVGALAFLLTACVGLTPTPAPTLAAPTATPSQTIPWFPATNTPTVFLPSGLAPTLESPPEVGDLLLRDDFSDPSLWNTANSGNASAMVENGHLTLSLASGPLTIASLRSEPALGDFYIAATASTSLCRGNDQYGLLLRAAPGGNYYRLVLSCSGNLRFERVRGGAVDILVNWLPSGDVPLGAPAEVRIGVWASGSDLRILLNERVQFSLRDPIFHSGTLGFFAHASADTPVIVSFSDLEVYALPSGSTLPAPSATP